MRFSQATYIIRWRSMQAKRAAKRAIDGKASVKALMPWRYR
jgi:hypothetical protein